MRLTKTERFIELCFVSPIAAAVILGALTAFAVAVAWVTPSYFEARAFENATGRHVSTWDAMFVQLRVEAPAGEGR